jgi:hypothetical protein
MLKRLGTALCFSMLVAGTAHGQEFPQDQPPSETVDFICYMQTADGQVVDLSKVCDTGRIRTPSAPSAPAAVAPPAPATGQAATVLSPETNLGGLNIGGQNGSPLCFGVDAQGRACPSSQVTQE